MVIGSCTVQRASSRSDTDHVRDTGCVSRIGVSGAYVRAKRWQDVLDLVAIVLVHQLGDDTRLGVRPREVLNKQRRSDAEYREGSDGGCRPRSRTHRWDDEHLLLRSQLVQGELYRLAQLLRAQDSGLATDTAQQLVARGCHVLLLRRQRQVAC